MESPFVPAEELAKYFSVSVTTIRAWVRQNIIPAETYIKIGSTYRFNIADVENALVNKSQQEAAVADFREEEDAPQQLELNFNVDDDN